MKRPLIAGLAALILIGTLAACTQKDDSSGAPIAPSEPQSHPSIEQPEPSNEDPGTSENSATPEHALPDAALLEAMIEDFENPPGDKPAWSDARPSGVNLHYGDLTVPAPVELSAERGTSGCAIYVSEEATGIAYCVQEKVNPLLVLTSADRGQTWQTVTLEVEKLEAFGAYYLSYSGQNGGALMLEGEDGECLLYQTGDGGATWTVMGSFTGLEETHSLTIFGDQWFIAGRNAGLPVLLKSTGGEIWTEIPLPVDKGTYASGHCSEIMFTDGAGLAVVTVYDEEGIWTRLYFGSSDGGESWTLYRTGPAATS